MGTRIHLHRVLFITLSTAFIALLIEFTGTFDPLWPLYGIPIIVAALTFHAGGAILGAAVAVALVGFHALAAGLPLADPGIIEAVIGIGVFFAMALIAGVFTYGNERRIRDLERTSVYDPLTGLYSPSYFASRLAEEARRRARYGGEMALMLIELDEFAEFRDTFGTRRGDLLLEHLAEIVKIAIRNTDVLARYQGGTFALICPHCTSADAVAIAERVDALVRATEFEGDELEPVTMHTVSVGLGTYPEPARDAEALLLRAESDLKLAKEGKTGRTTASPRAEAARMSEA